MLLTYCGVRSSFSWFEHCLLAGYRLDPNPKRRGRRHLCHLRYHLRCRRLRQRHYFLLQVRRLLQRVQGIKLLAQPPRRWWVRDKMLLVSLPAEFLLRRLRILWPMESPFWGRYSGSNFRRSTGLGLTVDWPRPQLSLRHGPQ